MNLVVDLSDTGAARTEATLAPDDNEPPFDVRRCTTELRPEGTPLPPERPPSDGWLPGAQRYEVMDDFIRRARCSDLNKRHAIIASWML